MSKKKRNSGPKNDGSPVGVVDELDRPVPHPDEFTDDSDPTQRDVGLKIHKPASQIIGQDPVGVDNSSKSSMRQAAQNLAEIQHKHGMGKKKPQNQEEALEQLQERTQQEVALRDQRLDECWETIQRILRAYNCKLVVVQDVVSETVVGKVGVVSQ